MMKSDFFCLNIKHGEVETKKKSWLYVTHTRSDTYIHYNFLNPQRKSLEQYSQGENIAHKSSILYNYKTNT